MKKLILYLFIFLFLGAAFSASAYQLQIVYFQKGDVQIKNPETFQNFCDELKGNPRDYLINSATDFDLYVNILVPEAVNRDGRYSVKVFSENGTEQQIAELDISSSSWPEYYDNLGRDYYLKGS